MSGNTSVEQCDRELFIDLFAIPPHRRTQVRNGSEDGRIELQTIARHRQQAEAHATKIATVAADVREALELGVAYDALLRSYAGPLNVLCVGDSLEIDATYDRWLAATRQALSMLPQAAAEWVSDDNSGGRAQTLRPATAGDTPHLQAAGPDTAVVPRVPTEAEVRAGWARVSAALNDVEGGMYAALEDAACDFDTLLSGVPALASPVAGITLEAVVRLISTKADQDCGCPEEEWEVGAYTVNLHLQADGQANGHADAGDEGEAEITVNASTPELARSAILGWAAGLNGSYLLTPAASDTRTAGGGRSTASIERGE